MFLRVGNLVLTDQGELEPTSTKFSQILTYSSQFTCTSFLVNFSFSNSSGLSRWTWLKKSTLIPSCANEAVTPVGVLGSKCLKSTDTLWSNIISEKNLLEVGDEKM